MATRSQTDLATEVLRYLAVVGAGETATTADSDYVVARYYDKHAELSAPPEELAYWSRDLIPSEVFLTVRDLIANEVAMTFGRPMDPAIKENNDVTIMRRLRRHVQQKATGHSAPADYF